MHTANGHNLLKVAFVTHYSELYGANKSLLNLMEGLVPFGVKSYVVAPDCGRFTQELALRGITWSEFPMQWWVTNKNEDSLRLSKCIVRILQKFRQISFQSYRLRKILYSWNVDIVCTNSAVIPVGALAARSMRLPHIWYLRELCDEDYDFRFDFGKWITRKIISSSDAVVTVSKYVRSHYFGNQIPDNVFVIYNGVASRKFIERWALTWSKIGRRRKEFTLAIIGVLYPKKGQESAIRAVSIVKNRGQRVRLLIAGSASPAYLAHLKDLVASLQLERDVEFLGYINDPFAVIARSNVVLMCSHAEAMGRVTAESMVVGRAVIGKATGGTIELVEHESTGLLYSDGENELADCICKLADNPKLVEKMGEKAAIEGRRRFLVEDYASQFLEILRSLAYEKGTTRYTESR